MRKTVVRAGDQFGFWTVVDGVEHRNAGGRITMICQCRCGIQKLIRKNSLNGFGKCHKCVGSANAVGIETRFWKYVNKTESCWLWTGNKYKCGYGQIWLDRKIRLAAAHRVSWEIHNGPIPENLHVLHHCDVKECVRPDHLFLGTRSDNMADMIKKNRGRWRHRTKAT